MPSFSCRTKSLRLIGVRNEDGAAVEGREEEEKVQLKMLGEESRVEKGKEIWVGNDTESTEQCLSSTSV